MSTVKFYKREFVVSIVRVGMNEDGKYGDGFAAIFGKKSKKTTAAAKKPAAKKALAKKPAAKKK